MEEQGDLGHLAGKEKRQPGVGGAEGSGEWEFGLVSVSVSRRAQRKP